MQSLSAHLFANEPLKFSHLQATAEAGYTQVELWAMKPNLDCSDPSAMANLKEWMAALTLEAPSFHAPFYAHLDMARAGRWLSLAHSDPEQRLEAINEVQASLIAMANLGSRIAVLHPSAPGSTGNGDTADGFRQSVERLIPIVEHLDLTLAVENIPAPLGGAKHIKAIIERIGHPRVRVCLDSGHAFLTEGEAAPEAFQQLAPLAATTHLHDNDGESDGHLIPGKGKVPFPTLWRALDEANYKGPLTFELRSREGSNYATFLDELVRAAPLATGGQGNPS